jgi:DNA-binding NarL/FixJ family response regulator
MTRTVEGTLMDRLLLVEHNLLFRDGLALLLKWRTGLSSDLASSLTEARYLLHNAARKPICAIVDFDVPGGEGIELLKQLKGLPVLALIRSRSMERQAEAIESGADEVLSTTGPTENIVAAVERLAYSEAKRRRLVKLEDQARPSHVV